MAKCLGAVRAVMEVVVKRELVSWGSSAYRQPRESGRREKAM